MTSEELVEKVKAGESSTVEFKASFDKEVLETCVALANTKGGIILIGISDKGEIKGVQVGKETLKNWANQISQSSEPRIIPEIEIANVSERTATRNLSSLVSLSLFKQIGITGKGTEYILLTRHKDARDAIRPNCLNKI
ncbi:MAG: helix-turn-helix domain-containing protein [Candidatus Saccharicenans sp.]